MGSVWELREGPLLLRKPEGAFYGDAAAGSEFFDIAAMEVPRVGWYWFAVGDSVTNLDHDPADSD